MCILRIHPIQLVYQDTVLIKLLETIDLTGKYAVGGSGTDPDTVLVFYTLAIMYITYF